jgi:hypothetical protein
MKSFTIGERVTTQLRAQVYNLTNTPQFQTPENNYTYGNFGQLSSNGPRQSPPNRELELALRVSF